LCYREIKIFIQRERSIEFESERKDQGENKRNKVMEEKAVERGKGHGEWKKQQNGQETSKPMLDVGWLKVGLNKLLGAFYMGTVYNYSEAKHGLLEAAKISYMWFVLYLSHYWEGVFMSGPM
jgi:hypothetical protein